jgi:FtsH-binding integral membrane protein
MNNSSLYTLQPTPEMIEETQRSFMVRVYGWMTLGLVITAGASFFTLRTPALLKAITTTPFLFLGLLLAELGVVIFLTAAVKRLSPVVAGMAFIGYAVLNGVTLSILFLVYTSSSIAETFVIAACTFGIMALFGYTTRRDLTALGNLLFMGLIGLVLAMLLNFLLQNPAIYWITTILGILVFIGLIAYDTQKLKNMSLAVGVEGDSAQKASILGALALYLDFINLFLLLLRIFGRRR